MHSRTPLLIGISAALAVSPALAQVPAQPPVAPPEGAAVVPTATPVPKATRNDLINSASQGNLDRVKLILEANPEFISGNDSQTPLSSAISNGQVEVTRYLLEKGADPNSGGWDSNPLMAAINRYDDKWRALADLLAEKKVDVNAADGQGNGLTPLQRVLQNSNDRQRERVQWLLDHGASIYTGRGGVSAIDTAIANSNVETVKLLLAKADVKRRDDAGQTVLFGAVRSGKIDIIRAILERGADINAQNAYGDTPLHLTARGDGTGAASPNSDLLKMLLDAGANPNLANARGDLPLHLALRRDITLDRTLNAQTGDYPAPPNPNAIPRGLLLAPLIDKTDINARDGGGFSPILLTLIARDSESRDLIRDRNPKMDSTTALFDAIVGGEVTKVEQTLKAKPYLTFFRLPDGSTPLHMAALWGTIRCAEELVKRGADVNARDARGYTPLHNTLRNPTARFARRSVNMTTFLLSKGANPNISTPSGDAPLHLAARAGDNELISLLLAKGARINAHGAGGDTALLILTNRNTAIAQYQNLITRGADVNARNGILDTTNAYVSRSYSYASYGLANGSTPLHRAVVARRNDMISALLDKGANIEALDSSGRTPLVLAISSYGYGSNSESASDLVTLLLNKGANPNIKVERSDLLSTAVERGNVEIVRALLASKKVSLKSSPGRRPLLYTAANSGRTEIVRLLLDAGADPLEADSSGRTPLQGAYSEEIKKLLTERITQIQGTKPADTAATTAPPVVVRGGFNLRF